MEITGTCLLCKEPIGNKNCSCCARVKPTYQYKSFGVCEHCLTPIRIGKTLEKHIENCKKTISLRGKAPVLVPVKVMPKTKVNSIADAERMMAELDGKIQSNSSHVYDLIFGYK